MLRGSKRIRLAPACETGGWPAHLHSNTLALFVFAIVGMGMSVVLAVMSWHLFEKHFLRLKDYFNDAPQAAVSGQAGADRAMTA